MGETDAPVREEDRRTDGHRRQRKTRERPHRHHRTLFISRRVLLLLQENVFSSTIDLVASETEPRSPPDCTLFHPGA